jgi:hypothetical protein
MSNKLLAVLAIALLIFSCKGDKKVKTFSGFNSISSQAAIKLINSYADSRVPHDLKNIIKSIQINAKEFSDLTSSCDSVKLFTAADTITYMPTIVIQTITRKSAVSYEYYTFENAKGTICPPPYDCYIELAEATK